MKKLSNLMSEFELKNFPKINLPYGKDYMREYMKRYRILALKRIAGDKLIICSSCGCNELSFLEINHKENNGNKDKEYINENTGKPKRRTIQFYLDVARGIRPVDDLDIRCKVCNSLELLKTKNLNAAANKYKIIWR